MEPPELVTVGDPKNPEKNLKMIIDVMLGARAQAIWNKTNNPKTILKILFRPLQFRLICQPNIKY